MRKKDTFLLLVPSALFAAMALAALIGARAFSLDPKDRDSRRKLDHLVQQVQSGELHPTQDRLIEMVRDSRDLQDEGRQTVGKFFRVFGCVSLCGAALQIYLVLRLKPGVTPTPGTNQSLHSTPR
jgi:hypothetical protein